MRPCPVPITTNLSSLSDHNTLCGSPLFLTLATHSSHLPEGSILRDSLEIVAVAKLQFPSEQVPEPGTDLEVMMQVSTCPLCSTLPSDVTPMVSGSFESSKSVCPYFFLASPAQALFLPSAFIYPLLFHRPYSMFYGTPFLPGWCLLPGTNLPVGWTHWRYLMLDISEAPSLRNTSVPISPWPHSGDHTVYFAFGFCVLYFHY